MKHENDSGKKRIVVGISGASGIIYGIEMLRALKDLGYESHVVISKAAKDNIRIETDITSQHVERMAFRIYDVDDLAAPISSGSFLTRGMVVIPCTIKSLSAIANSFNETLLVRAADVTLKERRPLILVVRETPLHRGHLQLMLNAAISGATILPPVPAFYHHPQTINDLILQTVGKCLDSLSIDHELFHRWHGP